MIIIEDGLEATVERLRKEYPDAVYAIEAQALETAAEMLREDYPDALPILELCAHELEWGGDEQ